MLDPQTPVGCSTAIGTQGCGFSPLELEVSGSYDCGSEVSQCLLHMPQVESAWVTAENVRRSEAWAEAGACVANMIILL